MRSMVRENHVRTEELIYPLFVMEGENIVQPVESMPGICQYSVDRMNEELDRVKALQIPAILIFGIPEHKDEVGSGAYDEHGIVQTAIRRIKKDYPDLLVIADVCLCEYTSHGHCGLIRDGIILNDETLPLLAQTAVSYARAGADIIAPSDMMDKRVGAIRQALDAAGFTYTPIMAYSAKFASGYYGPFRDAAHSAPGFGDRKTYQMDPANGREAMREVEEDIAEGADLIIAKPAMAYMDIITEIRRNYNIPIVAYNVSGEYSMVKAAAANGWIDEKKIVMENLIGMKRAGADMIITYHALDVAEWIDYVCSWGPGILGHADSRVIEKVKAACEEGLTFGAPTEREVEMAELLAQLVPSMEVSRLVSSGTEATMSAIRVARGYTKRDKIIKFRGCYHGHSDGLLVKAGSAALTTSVPDSAGVPADFTRHTLVAEYNSPDSVKALFEAYPDEIAAIIVEPVAANMGVVPPADGFLEFLREITKHYGALFIFDEVITGFRLALGGAQEYFHITPDLSTFGKIIGGGMPVGAYGGREDIMRMVSPDGPVYQAGTLSGNPIATAAGLATLRILEADTDIYMRLQENTAMLADAVRHAAGNRVHVNQIGSLMSIFFTGEDVTDYDSATTADTKAYADYFGFMLDHGIYVAPSQFESMFVSDAHTDADIQKTIHVMQEYFAE